jgi:hypothetical protein
VAAVELDVADEDLGAAAEAVATVHVAVASRASREGTLGRLEDLDGGVGHAEADEVLGPAVEEVLEGLVEGAHRVLGAGRTLPPRGAWGGGAPKPATRPALAFRSTRRGP